MSLSNDEIKKIAHLARLNLSAQDIAFYTPQLSTMLSFVAQMDEVDTHHIQPLAHPLDLSQRLRDDVVSETNQRQKFQALAPRVEAGLYLVPQVIEEAE
jgi:aspartyl-tRNA(Asn)/glutamyl-tRNA(Gln) amidotransferase subunit C